jgi:hypothetical protein
MWSPAAPSVAVETLLPDYDEYEVRIYDARRNRRLVAAIEFVSPANKDRPESRNAFIAKCAALLQKGVAVNVVDLVRFGTLTLSRSTSNKATNRRATTSAFGKVVRGSFHATRLGLSESFFSDSSCWGVDSNERRSISLWRRRDRVRSVTIHWE